ncbi:MAG TPA: sulfite exporter TauE/SafE family protein, partial [Xanthobacteraceae bacterium]
IPLIVGSAVGVPLGILVLRWVPPGWLRMAIGALLILFSLYNLARPKLPDVKGGGQAADAGVGFLNGVVGGSTGLAGILIVIWANMRGWPRDEQRAAFQPTGVATFLITLIALGGSGIITADTLKLFALGLPALAIGTWSGWKMYGKLDETSFRKGVLVLLLISGVALVIRR